MIPNAMKKLKWDIDSETECWNVISHAPNNKGYIRIMRNSISYQAHRYVWKKVYGSIPKGLCVLHSCDNRKCINPEHLFLGTDADNMKDMDLKGRRACGENHGRAELKNKEIIQIKKLLKEEKYTQTAIASFFNISDSHISNIKANRTWGYIKI